MFSKAYVPNQLTKLGFTLMAEFQEKATPLPPDQLAEAALQNPRNKAYLPSLMGQEFYKNNFAPKPKKKSKGSSYIRKKV